MLKAFAGCSSEAMPVAMLRAITGGAPAAASACAPCRLGGR